MAKKTIKKHLRQLWNKSNKEKSNRSNRSNMSNSENKGNTKDKDMYKDQGKDMGKKRKTNNNNGVRQTVMFMFL